MGYLYFLSAIISSSLCLQNPSFLQRVVPTYLKGVWVPQRWSQIPHGNYTPLAGLVFGIGSDEILAPNDTKARKVKAFQERSLLSLPLSCSVLPREMLTPGATAAVAHGVGGGQGHHTDTLMTEQKKESLILDDAIELLNKPNSEVLSHLQTLYEC